MPVSFAILAAFGAMICWGIGDFLIQRSTRKIGNLESLAFISIIGALALFPLVINELPLLFTTENILLLAFVGIVTFFVALLNFEALKKGKLSVVEVVLEVELPVTTVLGFLFLGESVTPAQLGAIALIFTGAVLISVGSLSANQSHDIQRAHRATTRLVHYRFKRHLRLARQKRLWYPMMRQLHCCINGRCWLARDSFRKLEKGVMLAVITAAGMALVNFLTAFGSRQVSPIMAIWIPWVVIGLVSLFLIGKREGFGNLLHNGVRFEGLIIWMGIIDTLAWLLYAVALSKNGLAITTAITESYPAIAIVLGVIVNREKILAHQYAGAAIALLASVGLAFAA